MNDLMAAYTRWSNSRPMTSERNIAWCEYVDERDGLRNGTTRTRWEEAFMLRASGELMPLSEAEFFERRILQ